MRQVLVVLTFLWIGCTAARPELVPVPESQQAAQALAIIGACHGPRPAIPAKKLHVVYFTPSDREPGQNYEQRLGTILMDIQAFYRDGMERLGFGPMTFPLVRDARDKLVIHLVKGKAPGKSYAKPDGEKIFEECRPTLEAAGISVERETVLIFCNLAEWDENHKVFSHHSPYYGMWGQTSGLCFALDSVVQNLEDLPKKKPILNDDEYGDMSLGKFNTVFIGGIAHELGHAFALPHCGERWDEKTLGTSIMGAGNHTYREEQRGEGNGSFLTMASAMKLAGRPLFNGCDTNMGKEPQLQECTLLLSTNAMSANLVGRHAALRVEGTVTGTPAVYGVIAYFDSLRDGGYRAPAATAVPDARGKFAIEVSDLAPCGNGELRVEFCHVNGAISERRIGFTIDPDGGVDLTQWQLRQALEPIGSAVAVNDPNAARIALQNLEASRESETVKSIGRKLVGTLDRSAKPTPAEVSTTITNLALGEAQPESAKVGWLQPAENRIPANNQVPSPLLDSGKVYATGLYAHAPSSYVFNLGGKWKELIGEAALHTFHQPYGSVIFIIKTDGHEVFRSAVIQKAKKANFKISVAGVKWLELVVDPSTDGNQNDWGLWLAPTLSR